MNREELKDLVYRVNGAAIEVHKSLGQAYWKAFIINV